MKQLLFFLLLVPAFSQENFISRDELFPKHISNDKQEARPTISPMISIVPDDALKLEKYKTVDNVLGSVFVWTVVSGSFINCLYCDMYYYRLGGYRYVNDYEFYDGYIITNSRFISNYIYDDYYYAPRFRPNHIRK